MLKLLRTLVGPMRHKDRGATTTEYALMVVLIAVVVVPALIALAPVVAGWYTGVLRGL
jgi:Flp pilus assembly pilin Flp